MKTKIFIAKVIKPLAAIFSLWLLVYELVNELPWFLKLTRPCAFSHFLEFITVAGIALLFGVSFCPIVIKTKCIKKPDCFLRNMSLIIVFGVFGNAVSTWLQYACVSMLHFLDWYDIADFVLVIFFLLLFINCYFQKSNRVLPSLLGIAYISITIVHQYYSEGHAIHGIFRNGMMVIVLLIVIQINIYKNLNHTFYFSDFSKRTFFSGDKKIKFRHAYSTAYSVQNPNKHILLRTDKGHYFKLYLAEKRIESKEIGALIDGEDDDYLDEMLTDYLDKDKKGITVMFNPLLQCSRGKEHIVLHSKLKKISIDSFAYSPDSFIKILTTMINF